MANHMYKWGHDVGKIEQWVCCYLLKY